MFAIVGAKGDGADPSKPGTGPMLTLTLELDGADTKPAELTIESLNGATRDHQNTNGVLANVQIFHIMCLNATSAQQFAIRDQINKNQAGFYDQLTQWNRNAAGVNAPLALFNASQPLKFEWPSVVHPSSEAESSLRTFLKKQNMPMKEMAAGADTAPGTMDGPVPTPCYVLTVVSNPESGDLLDASLTAVVHAGLMAPMAGP